MRVLVTGGRGYARRDAVYKSLDLIHSLRPITVLIHGRATGADELADAWARAREVARDPFMIIDGEGGFARNRRMLVASYPDLVVHFPGNNGTADMIRRAREADVDILGGLDRIGTIAMFGEQTVKLSRCLDV